MIAVFVMLALPAVANAARVPVTVTITSVTNVSAGDLFDGPDFLTRINIANGTWFIWVVASQSVAVSAATLETVFGDARAYLAILAVFTHEQHGSEALAFLLRGMLSGMAGFVVFCALVAVLVDRAGAGATFTAAALAAVCVQAATARAASRPPLPRSA